MSTQHGLQPIVHGREVFAAWYCCPLCKGTLCTVNQARELDFKCPNEQREAHLNQLQALVDNIVEVGISPTDGMVEACQYLEANGRPQSVKLEVEP